MGDGTGIGFRGGPERLGAVAESPPNAPAEVWAVDTSDPVISSPVPVENGVVVAGGDGVLRLIETTGDVVWETDLAEVESTPVVVGNQVIVGTLAGRVISVGLGDGATTWTADLGGRIRSSPLAFAGIVMLGAGEELVALNGLDGEVVWRANLGVVTSSSPALSSEIVIVGDGSNTVHGFEAADGAEIWTYEFDPVPEDFFVVAEGVVSAPALEDGTAWIGSTNGTVAALLIESGDGVWEADLGAPVYSSAALADNALFLTTAAGEVVALDKAQGEVLWRVDLGEPSYASPTVAGSVVIATTEEGLIFGLQADDGSELWRVTVGRDGDFMASTPIVTEELLVVGSNDGRIVALGEG